jgi:hypothetical protein
LEVTRPIPPDTLLAVALGIVAVVGFVAVTLALLFSWR